VAVGVITTTDAHRGFSSGGPAASATLIDWFTDPGSAGRTATVPPVPAAVLAKWRSIPGVQGVLLTHTNPLGVTIPDAKAGLPSGWGPVPAGLVSCVQLSRTPTLGRCPAGAAAAVVPTQLPLAFISSQAATVWPAAAISAQRLQQLPVLSITVGTDGSASAIEGVRTALEAAYPGKNLPPTTIGEIRAGLNSTLAGEQQLANVVILTSLPIAGCTLAVSIVAGLNDRKRPFSLLRLTGAPLGTLRRVVALESAVPLLIVAVVSIGAGFLAAQLFLTSQLHYSLRPPGAGYYLIVLAGLAASLGIVASTLPLLNRLTGPDTARNE
jgi:hypothetical protein